MYSVDDLKDLIDIELRDVMAGVRPPESSEYTRHLPDPVVVNFLIVNILLPILTGVVSGLLTTWIGSRDEKKDIAGIKSSLRELRITLEKIAKTEHFDDDVEKEFDNTADDILRLRDQISGSVRTDDRRQQIEAEVINTLERFHLGPHTAQLKGIRIVRRALEVIETSR
jgi:hypothetical protein